MDFGKALEAIKKGKKLQRAGWNGSGMHLKMQPANTGAGLTHPYLVMYIPGCPEGVRKLPWQPAQVDIFSEDWSIIEG